MATQNPIETEGTYPLPEAQVDRFMMKVLVDYPSEEEEFVIAQRVTGVPTTVAAVASMSQLGELQQECRKVYVDPSLMQYAVKIVSATRRPDKYELPELADLPDLRRQPARHDRPDRRRARAGLHARAQLRAARGHDRAGPRRAAPPPGAELRSAGRRPPADALIQRMIQKIPVPDKPLAHGS